MAPDPTPTPLHPTGVPAGSPSCTAAATKGDEFVMLRCQWEGGTPPVTLRWQDGGGQALGDPSPSATVLVLGAGGSLRGQDFVCAAAHPLRATGTECRLRLGKPCPSAGCHPAARGFHVPTAVPSRWADVPRLEAESSEVAVLEGSEARLACRRHDGGASLGATMVWYDPKEQEVTLGLAKYQLEQGEVWLNLTVRDAEWPGDGGTYHCAATNAVGTASLPVHLRVESESWQGCGVSGAGVIESQRHFGWTSPGRSSSPSLL